MGGKLSPLLIAMLIAGLAAFGTSGCSAGKKLDLSYILDFDPFGETVSKAEKQEENARGEEVERVRQAAQPVQEGDVSPPLPRGEEPAELVGSLDPFVEAVDDLVKKIEAAFSPVDGYIVAVEDDNIFLSLSARNGIRRGTVLDVIRQGDYLRHPSTDEVLGRYEEDLGTIEVIEVRDDYSVGIALSENLVRMKRGDIARISSGKIELAILPVTSEVGREIDTGPLYDELMEGLGESGRFHIFDRDRVEIWLLERGYRPDQLLKGRTFEELKRDVPSDHYLFTTLKSIKGRYILIGSLFSNLAADEVRKFSAIVRETDGTRATQLSPSPR